MAAGAPLSSVPPAVSLEAAALAALSVLGVLETLVLELAEFESSDDPLPQPASTSAATASAKMILALAVLTGFVI
ncbi:MAG TPA: hypothetical protein VMR96_11025 [Solirubrobacterales bacterium]|nr:hypothetical protein [Solirubrobacterales bacterium]